MLKRSLAAAAIVLVVGIALVVRMRVSWGSEQSRIELAKQLSNAFGEPVTVGAVSASAFGPVITLSDVAVGQGDALIHADAVRLRPGIASLVARRIDSAAMTVVGLRATPPLRGFSVAGGEGPLAVAHLRSLTLDDAEIVTHGRRLRIDADLVPHDGGLRIARGTVAGDDMRADLAGDIADLHTGRGELSVRGESLDGDVLRSLAWDLLDSPTAEGSAEQAPTSNGQPGLALDIDVRRLTLGPAAATAVKGKAQAGPGAIAFDPIAFDAFGGHYQGQMTLRFEGGVPSVRWYGDVTNVTVAGLTTQATGAAAITGTLSGDVDLTGTGVDFAKALTSVRGSARITLSNGRIAKLALARAIVAASASNPQESAQRSSSPEDTPFKTFATALSISGGSASLLDTRLDSDDLTLLGGGGLKLDGSAVTLFADVQLSTALSEQIAANRGRTLEPAARLTVPVTIRGNTSHYQISVDSAEMTTAPLGAGR